MVDVKMWKWSWRDFIAIVYSRYHQNVDLFKLNEALKSINFIKCLSAAMIEDLQIPKFNLLNEMNLEML